jgi:hypothetical protein
MDDPTQTGVGLQREEKHLTDVSNGPNDQLVAYVKSVKA